MIDVLLINPRRGAVFAPNPPLVIAQVAACLEENGLETRIIDLCVENLNKEQLLKRIESLNPAVIGIIENLPGINEAVKVGWLIKENFDIPLVIGGLNVSLDPTLFYRFKNIFDYTLIGEWEITFPLLVKKILKKENPKERIIVGNQVEDLNILPFPAYHLLPIEKYTLEYFTISSSKGCPFNCIFCPFTTNRIRFRSEERVVEEIKWLMEDYKIKKFSFRDENLPIAKKHSRNLSQEIMSEGLDIEWKCQARCDLLDRNTIATLKKGGCDTVGIGIETGSETLRRKINKPITNGTILKVVDNCKKVGLKVVAFMMLGFPWETEEDLKKSVNLIKEIKPYGLWVQLATPLPRTKYFDIAVKHGMDKYAWHKYAGGETTFPPFTLSKSISTLKYMYYLSRLNLCIPRSLTNIPVLMNTLSIYSKLIGHKRDIPHFDKFRKMANIFIKHSPDKLTF